MKIRYSTAKIHNPESTKKPAKFVGSPHKDAGLFSGRSTLSYLFYFLLLVGISIIVALAARFIFLYQKSTFTTSSYAVFVNSEKPFIAVYDKNVKQFSLVSVPSLPLDKTQEGMILGIPIDAEIKTKKVTRDNFASTSTVLGQLFKPWEYKYQDMTVLDGLRLIFASYSIPKKDIRFSSLKLSKNKEVVGITQEELYSIFKDTKIVDEQKSIEIVNATDITGLAGMVGRVIKNVGGNVVSIRSGDEEHTTSIVASRPSETVSRISRLLGVESLIKEDMASITDIQIVLGSDFGNKVSKIVE